MTKKSGKIDISELDEPPLKAEFLTAKVLIMRATDVKFLKPNRRKGAKTPDILMNNEKWEIKCPKSNGKYTIEHAYRSALKQSGNVIFNLRQIEKIPDEKLIREITRRFNDFQKAKRLIIITKSKKILDFYK